eukprot:TRINITY_DN47252_c0_g1_i1.p1 TRINITY_DN47252_c0_g1~~TRINITY_DN47252_c0_g1_i1.p1  ORF type:complete len:1218 (+),score=420.02 TRINITY_DN47252_c0_g1_i1:33-3656(+)
MDGCTDAVDCACTVAVEGSGLATVRLKNVTWYTCKHTEEFEHVIRLEHLHETGVELAGLLYSHRSVSACMAGVEEADPGTITQAQAVLLVPQLLKLRSLLDFITTSQQAAYAAVDFYIRADGKKCIASDVFVTSFAKLVDACIVIDKVMIGNAAILSDWEHLKELSGKTGGTTMQEAFPDAAEIQAIFTESASPGCNHLLSGLYEEIRRVSAWQDAIVACINHCVTSLTDATYMTPEEKFRCIRVTAILMGWVDERRSLEKDKVKKHLLMDLVKPVLKRYPYVPVFADIHMRLDTFTRQCCHIELVDTESKEAKIEAHYTLTEQKVKDIRASFFSWTTQWGLRKLATPAAAPDKKATEEMWSTIRSGLRLLTDMTCLLWENSCWKSQGGTCSYTEAEQLLVLDVLRLAKGMATELEECNMLYGKGLKTRVHDRLQQFIHVEMRDLLRKTKKEGRREAHTALLNIRDCFGDWKEEEGGIAPQHDKALEGKHDDVPPQPVWPTRGAALSPSAVTILHGALSCLISSRNPGMKKGFRTVPDFVEKRKKVIDDILEDVRVWPYLLDIEAAIEACGNVAFLWFSEWEQDTAPLTAALVDTCLHHPNLKTCEVIYLPLHIHDDAYKVALRRWHSELMVVEVERDVEAAVRKVAAVLAEKVFMGWKGRWAVELDDKLHQSTAGKKKEDAKVCAAALKWCLQQEYLAPFLATGSGCRVIGRYVDMHDMLSIEVNKLFQQNIKEVVDGLKDVHVAEVCYVDMLLKVLKRMHGDLVQAGLRLDTWDTLTETRGIVEWVVVGLYDSALREMNYNMGSRRFTGRHDGEKFTDIDAMWLFGTQEITAHYDTQHAAHSSYIGKEHVQAIVSLGNYAPVIIAEATARVNKELRSLSEILTTLAMPITTATIEESLARSSSTQDLINHYEQVFEGLNRAQVTAATRCLVFVGNVVCFLALLDEVLEFNAVLQVISDEWELGLRIQNNAQVKEGTSPVSHEVAVMSDTTVDKIDAKVTVGYPFPSSDDFLQCDASSALRIPRFDTRTSWLRHHLLSVECVGDHQCEAFMSLYALIRFSTCLVDSSTADSILYGGATVGALLSRTQGRVFPDLAGGVLGVYKYRDPAGDLLWTRESKSKAKKDKCTEQCGHVANFVGAAVVTEHKRQLVENMLRSLVRANEPDSQGDCEYEAPPCELPQHAYIPAARVQHVLEPIPQGGVDYDSD